jgi:hypothetical protein
MNCGRYAGGLAILALVATAVFGARATDLLDPLEGSLQQVVTDLEGDESKDAKKQRNAAASALAKLAKDTVAPLDDVKTLKKLAGGITKKLAGFQPVIDAVDGAAEEVDDAVEVVIGQARDALAVAGDSKKKKKATKKADKAEKLLGKSRAKPTTKARVSVLFGARKNADKALEAALDLPPGSGGGAASDSLVLAEPNGVPGVYLVSIDNKAPTLLTPGGAVETDPAPRLAPDGSRFAYVQGDRVKIGDGAGTTIPGASNTWEHIAWSPDSAQLAAVGSNPAGLWIFDLAGVEVRMVADTIKDGAPTSDTIEWSPDSKCVAVRTDRGTDGAYELRILDVAADTYLEVSGVSSAILYAKWSPDSSLIAYVTNADATNGSDAELLVVKKDGTGRLQLSEATDDVRDFGTDTTFAWSPVANELIYEERADSRAERVVRIRADGTGRATLATLNSIDRFAWSSTGARVAILGDAALKTILPDGTGGVELTDRCPDFLWGPDGDYIAYREGSGGIEGNDLWTARADGTDKLQMSRDLVAGGDVREFYTFIPGGGLSLLFASDPDKVGRFSLFESVVEDAPGKGKADVEVKIRFAQNSELTAIGGRITSDVTAGNVRTVIFEGTVLVDDSLNGQYLVCKVVKTKVYTDGKLTKETSDASVCSGPLDTFSALLIGGAAALAVR